MSKFTDDEKIIAKNISKEYKWIARDKSGLLCASALKPHKDFILDIWDSVSQMCDMDAFGWMFKSITWEDKEPTLIRDIYNPQIIDRVERKYLKTILKPFRKKVGFAMKCGEQFDDNRGYYRKEYLLIKFHDDDGFAFPSFDAGKMYSGMERNKKYTLDELGITYDD